MATGRLPFPGNTSAAIFGAILQKAPAPPARVNPDLSPELDRIISKALEKDRKLRYQNAADIRIDLQRLKRDTDSSRAAVSASFLVIAPRPWWRSWAALSIAVGVLVLLLRAGFTGSRREARRSNSVAVLPFVNASADPHAEYLSDGITESLINGRVRNLTFGLICAIIGAT